MVSLHIYVILMNIEKYLYKKVFIFLMVRLINEINNVIFEELTINHNVKTNILEIIQELALYSIKDLKTVLKLRQFFNLQNIY